MAGKMSRGKPCWFQVPSLEQMLLLVLEGASTPEHAAASDSTSSKLGTFLVTVCFPRRVLVSLTGPQLIESAVVWLGSYKCSPQAKTTWLHIL